MPTTVERKYAMTRLGPGDYLLPSNDGNTVWRIRKYTDGPSLGLEDWPRDREVWGVWRWTDRTSEYVDPDDWPRWDMWEGLHETRQSAIDCALSARPTS